MFNLDAYDWFYFGLGSAFVLIAALISYLAEERKSVLEAENSRDEAAKEHAGHRQKLTDLSAQRNRAYARSSAHAVETATESKVLMQRYKQRASRYSKSGSIEMVLPDVGVPQEFAGQNAPQVNLNDEARL